jgi:hypothetical protein
MGIRWANSAAKHGIDQADAINAIANYVYRVPAFDEPRVPGGRRPDLFIGPTRDQSMLLEVMAEVTPPADIFVFHVMEARRKNLDIAERGTK